MLGLRYNISKFIKPDRSIYLVSPLINKIPVGKFDFVVKNNLVILNNFHINENYRYKKYGSYFLNKMENYVKNNYNAKSVRLLSYEQPIFDENVLPFFQKCGYSVNYKNSNLLENGESYIDIYYVEKLL